ncbi:hypothetical protein L6164_001569 [Bauhinia variegata]|uniref:Uncharacterized protein n=1 Tax=Bauhinia variegata TaxID=167791 RepID=A0ACB9QC86_BAUVA|nr:hypothetical protein L6164_001569 [Bauhinia variegata]
MACVERVGTNVELKSTAEKFFKRLTSEIHHAPAASSEKVHSVEVHEGDWGTHGSVKLWKFTLDGKAEQMKERVEIDEANKTITFVAIEGHVLELYKTYKVIIKVDESGLANITLEYEKLNEQVPTPNNYLQLVAGIVEDLEAPLVKGN